MQSVALQIKPNGKVKVVGKIIIMPSNNVLPQFAGIAALYRENIWKDVVSSKLKCISVDAGCWEYCSEQKVGGMIVYCKDVHKIVTVKRSIINSCRVIDLGGNEFPQYRIPLSKCRIYENIRSNIPTPWIVETKTIEPRTSWVEDDLQSKLF